MYRGNWEKVFSDLKEKDSRVLAANKCLSLFYSPLWSTEDVKEFYERGYGKIEKPLKYQNDRERNRDWNRHSFCSYRTRKELDEVSGNPEVADRLIDMGILRLHKKWRYPKTVIQESPFVIVHNPDISKETIELMNRIYTGKHPEAPYRLHLGSLSEIVDEEKDARLWKGALLVGHFVGHGDLVPLRM
ncbi:MAG: hypothetical protein NTY20_04440 [Candidatus Aenigmarchaeota archaeon]|nr:hypothetical protein [Candidatus Aenigmarchaeota archaeon]